MLTGVPNERLQSPDLTASGQLSRYRMHEASYCWISQRQSFAGVGKIALVRTRMHVYQESCFPPGISQCKTNLPSAKPSAKPVQNSSAKLVYRWVLPLEALRETRSSHLIDINYFLSRDVPPEAKPAR